MPELVRDQPPQLAPTGIRRKQRRLQVVENRGSRWFSALLVVAQLAQLAAAGTNQRRGQLEVRVQHGAEFDQLGVLRAQHAIQAGKNGKGCGRNSYSLVDV